MKRALPFVIAGVVLIVLLAAVGGGVGVYYLMEWQRAGQPNKNRPDEVPVGPTFTVDELLDLQEKPDKAAVDIPRIVNCFDMNDEDLSLQAAETLKVIGAKAVDPLRAKLKSPNARVRFHVAHALGRIGPDAAGATGDLLERLKDDDAKVRYKSVYALGQLGVKSDAVIDGMLKALGDKEEDVSKTAIEALEKFGAPSKEALPTLSKLVRNKEASPQARAVVIKLLGEMGGPAVPALRDALKDADALGTIDVIKAIASLGKDAKPLLPDLQQVMLKNHNWDAEAELLGTFKKCGPDGALGLAQVLETLHDPKGGFINPDAGRSVALLKAIGEMGSDGKGTVKVLIHLLKERQVMHVQILECLGDIGPSAGPEAIAAAEALTNDPSLGANARAALRRMGKFEKK